MKDEKGEKIEKKEKVNKAKTDEKSFFFRVNKWFKECKSEIKKVIWPDKKQVVNNTIAVIIMVLVSTIFISILDVGFYWPIKFLLEKL